ncbi:putative short-chain dehydrogenase [Leptodontidium sp. 2 PMI_412]|nr:putative short-chain dehydrogenase [Leptodontidium sp. MPI-SDFR-AT-0119]KAH9218339.1 putative short-chain dehydrogenase [Leptodontidium sp. 2 PMI_412]
MPSTFSAMFPPAPTFTEKDLPSLTGKVYIVTGAASGVGFELAKILYLAGGTVYIAARSTTRCEGAIDKIKTQTSDVKSSGKLESMVVDLADLRTVKGAVDGFLRRETRLDVLVHNAGVMTPPSGSKDKHGHDLEMGTNCLAPYLLTVLLEPILIRTAASSPSLSVRVVFVVSLLQLVPAGVMSFDSQGTPKVLPKAMDNYMQTKAGGTMLATEFEKRLGSNGILSVSVHPGLMRTELQRNMGIIGPAIMKLLFKGPVYGAYSELYAGFSPELEAKHNGGYVMAWGRIVPFPDDIAKALKGKVEGGSGARQIFVEYCDRETKEFR